MKRVSFLRKVFNQYPPCCECKYIEKFSCLGTSWCRSHYTETLNEKVYGGKTIERINDISCRNMREPFYGIAYRVCYCNFEPKDN